MKPTHRPSPLALVLLGGAVMGLALGARHVQGLFLVPLTSEHGWSRTEFALALALQNLMWGVAQPLTGMLADRFGSARVIGAGCLLYALGLLAMAHSATPVQFTLSAGVLVGMALSCTSFGTVYGALSRMLPPERRGWGLGLAGAAGGLGQFAAVPVAQGALGSMGAQATLVLLAAALAASAVCGLPFKDKTPSQGTPSQPLPLRAMLAVAARHRSLWLLGLGFLACGFQLAFIATHLPAYLLDRGLDGRSAMAALSIIAMANVGGTYAFGLLGARMRKARLLSAIYLLRSSAIAAFVLLPLSDASLYAFVFCMGVLWLGTVPLTNGIVSQVFGVHYLGTLFGLVFLGHQIGSFLGIWIGGLVFDATRSYAGVWWCAVAVGLLAAALHWPISERPYDEARPDAPAPSSARPAGALLVAALFTATLAWTFLQMLEPQALAQLLDGLPAC